MIPRDFFPNMPDEVFEMWLKPIAEEYGWPFKNCTDCIEDIKWFKVFGELDLGFWVIAKWQRKEIDLTTAPFCKDTRFRIRQIIKYCVSGIPTFTAGVARSKERFGACADFIRANESIPKPIIILFRNGVAEIVDGNHRIAALLHVGSSNGYVVPAWVIDLENL